jgi:GNAT superfamily N-acetyltransferase
VIHDPERLLGGEQLGDALERLLAAVSPIRVVAGWATVDLDRATDEVATALSSLGAARVEAAADDGPLGARACLLRFPEGRDLLLLEPSTEGLLAASLARFGEGRVALYLVVGPAALAKAGTAGFRLSDEADGPLGRQRRVAGGPRWGPHLMLVLAAQPGTPATIETMTEQATVLMRPARSGDAERIAALFTDEGYPAGPSDIVARLERFASDYSKVVVADLDGEVLGFIAFHALPRFEHDDRIVRVLALVVDPGVRERGVGHQLMAEAERAARELGAAFVEVTAGHHRPEARHLYESLGYDASVTAYLRKRV